VPPVEPSRSVDRLAEGRRRHPEAWRTIAFASLYLAGAILWRTPLTVDALEHHPWLSLVEAATLIAVGVGLWLELVESPPLTPRSTRPTRVALAAISMWVIWILAYLVGLSHGSWYQAYPHHAGTGLSLSADQQLTTGVMWFVSACAFVPVVYWNLVRWLQSEENPDEELHHLVRQERIRGRPLGPDRPSP
jgi:cytochrome c oxidase assembly factor CtaG